MISASPIFGYGWFICCIGSKHISLHEYEIPGHEASPFSCKYLSVCNICIRIVPDVASRPDQRPSGRWIVSWPGRPISDPVLGLVSVETVNKMDNFSEWVACWVMFFLSGRTNQTNAELNVIGLGERKQGRINMHLM